MDGGLSILNIWAVIFLTCIVGLIEFLKELDDWHKFEGKKGITYSLYKPAVFSLYFCLVFGAIMCIDRFIRYYFTVRKDLPSGGCPILDAILLFGKPEIPILTGSIIIVFIFGSLFLCRTECHPIVYLKQKYHKSQ